MYKPRDPKDLAIDLLDRSICSVQCAAVIFDNRRIIAWGHNHVGFDGLGEHAEICAVRRANRDRLSGAAIAIAGRRKRNQKLLIAFPCDGCMARLVKYNINKVWVHNREGIWQMIHL